MIGCVEFTFNASFFLFGVALFFYLVWCRLSWYVLFKISINYQ